MNDEEYAKSIDIAERRLIAEERLFQEDDGNNLVQAGPRSNDDLFLWDAMIVGPTGTIWEGGVFKLEMRFPKDFPSKPPSAKFKTNVFHPNVSVDGRLDIVNIMSWKSKMSVYSILITI